MTARNAVSVFPEPVGAAISVWAPAAIAGQPQRWGLVAGTPRARRRPGSGHQVQRLGLDDVHPVSEADWKYLQTMEWYQPAMEHLEIVNPSLKAIIDAKTTEI